jgi:hypothetical protein
MGQRFTFSLGIATLKMGFQRYIWVFYAIDNQ